VDGVGALPRYAERERGEFLICRVVCVGLRGALENRTGRWCGDGRHLENIVS